MKKLTAEDLRRLVWVSSPAISRDGAWAACLKGTSDYESGKIIPALAEFALAGKGTAFDRARMPGYAQTCPVYSPDGRYLAFLAQNGGAEQLWLFDHETGNLQKLTDSRYGVAAPAWNPDGGKLIFEVVRYPGREEPEAGEMTAEEYAAFKRRLKEEPMEIDTLMYKLDEACGMLDGSISVVGTADVGGGWRVISDRDVRVAKPTYVQNGEKIACYRYTGKHINEMSAQLGLLSVDGGLIKSLSPTIPFYYQFPFADYEGGLLYCGASIREGGAIAEPCRVDLETGEATLIVNTEGVCHGVDTLLTGDTHLPQRDTPVQLDENGKMYLLSFHERRSNVFCLDKALQAVTDEDCVLDFALSESGAMLVLRSTWNHPAEVYLYAREGERFVEKRALTGENDWVNEYDLIEPRELTAVSTNDARIRGWAVVPETKAGEKIPAVLDMHGGPEACYVNGFYFETQVMATEGMAVLFCDPRGSAGYGAEFMKNEYAYGQEAVDDDVAFVRAAAEAYPVIDLTRVGVTGGSYGGYMTNKLISVTDAFAAAVAQRTWVNPSTSYGTGDMGFYAAGHKEHNFMEYMEGRVRRSIMKYIKNVHVPVLVLHGERDYRCGLEEGVQVYSAMRALHPDIPSRIVIFPGENHGVSRGGLIHNQILHIDEMNRWFATHLKKEARQHD